MPQMTTAEVCFHAGKSARFSASTPPTAWFDCLLCIGRDLPLPKPSKRGDPVFTTTRNLENVGS
jgi:hypothetical protein